MPESCAAARILSNPHASKRGKCAAAKVLLRLLDHFGDADHPDPQIFGDAVYDSLALDEDVAALHAILVAAREALGDNDA